MIKQDVIKMSVGIAAVLFSGYIFVTGNDEFISLVLVQSLIGLVISGLVKFSMSSFDGKRKSLGFFYIIAAALLFVTVIVANDLSFIGIFPLMVILIIFGGPISVMYMFSYYYEQKRQQLK